MPDREKVMLALNCCAADDCRECEKCPYAMIANGKKTNSSTCIMELASDALDLLKEQEPRVLEYSEIEKNPLVWLEDNDKEDVIPALFLKYNGWTAEFAVQAPDKYVDTIIRSAKVVSDERTYGITWRCWTSRPTPEQMRETTWEGEKDAEVH